MSATGGGEAGTPMSPAEATVQGRRNIFRRVPQRLRAQSRFVKETLVRFSHCDPAGVVFYPQYFVLFNALVEDWFNEALGVDYAVFIRERRVGLPTVKITCEFLEQSRIGERLVMSLAVTKMGHRSLVLSVDCSTAGEKRLRAEQVLVTTSLDTHRTIEIPADLRAKIAGFRVQCRQGEMQ